MNSMRKLLLKSAMNYGLIMGLFWGFKYIFFILGAFFSFFSFIYWGLTLIVPFLLLMLLLRFQVFFAHNLSFSRDWTLGILIFVFAALFVSLEHYVFYRYLAPADYIADSLSSAITLINQSGISEEVKNAIEAMSIPTPIQMTVQGILNNILYGVVVSLPVAMLSSRIKVIGKNTEKLS